MAWFYAAEWPTFAPPLTATEIFKQTLTINAMSQAMHSMAATSGAGNVDVYAQTRAARCRH